MRFWLDVSWLEQLSAGLVVRVQRHRATNFRRLRRRDFHALPEHVHDLRPVGFVVLRGDGGGGADGGRGGGAVKPPILNCLAMSPCWNLAPAGTDVTL